MQIAQIHDAYFLRADVISALPAAAAATAAAAADVDVDVERYH